MHVQTTCRYQYIASGTGLTESACSTAMVVVTKGGFHGTTRTHPLDPPLFIIREIVELTLYHVLMEIITCVPTLHRHHSI